MQPYELRGPGLARAGRRSEHPPREGFRQLLREAVRDPLAAVELTAGYAALPPAERRALRAVVEEDASRFGLEVDRILACWRALEVPVPERRWRAWVHEDRVVFTAPGRGALEAAPGARIRFHDDGWRPGPEHRSVEVEEAVDRFASILWTARRGGQRWPRRLGAFADLFDR